MRSGENLPAFPFPLRMDELSREALFAVFMSRWNVRFRGKLTVLGRNCCLSFAACWLEWCASPFRRWDLPGLDSNTGMHNHVSVEDNNERILPAMKKLAAGWREQAELFPATRMLLETSAEVGDVAWLTFPEGHYGDNYRCGGWPWKGFCAVCGGFLHGKDGERLHIWWVLRRSQDACIVPIAARVGEFSPAVFRPCPPVVRVPDPRVGLAPESEAAAGAALVEKSGGKLRLVASDSGAGLSSACREQRS